MVTGVRPFSPAILALNFYGAWSSAIPLLVDFSSSVATHALALSASQFVHKKRSQRIYTGMHSAGLELTKLAYTRLEDNLIRHRGDRYSLPQPGSNATVITQQTRFRLSTTSGCEINQTISTNKHYRSTINTDQYRSVCGPNLGGIASSSPPTPVCCLCAYDVSDVSLPTPAPTNAPTTGLNSQGGSRDLGRRSRVTVPRNIRGWSPNTFQCSSALWWRTVGVVPIVMFTSC